MNIHLGKKIFLIDAVGAVLSTLFLWLLSMFPEWFGMPKSICILLTMIAMGLAAHSLLQYYLRKFSFRSSLAAVIIGNLLYCSVTLYFLERFSSLLTGLGWMYFIGELLIILLLVIIEVRLLSNQ